MTNIYNAAYELNISNGRIHRAISNARSMDPSNGKLRIDLFCKFLEDAIFSKDDSRGD